MQLHSFCPGEGRPGSAPGTTDPSQSRCQGHQWPSQCELRASSKPKKAAMALTNIKSSKMLDPALHVPVISGWKSRRRYKPLALQYSNNGEIPTHLLFRAAQTGRIRSATSGNSPCKTETTVGCSLLLPKGVPWSQTSILEQNLKFSCWFQPSV